MVGRTFFVRRLRAIRVATGFYESSFFAEMAGISAERYRQIECGEVEIGLDELASLAAITGCSIDWLVTGRVPQGGVAPQS